MTELEKATSEKPVEGVPETHKMQKRDMRGLVYSTRVDVDDVSLVIVEGPHEGETLRLTQEVTNIGRYDWCDLSLPQDTWVSGQHCEVWLENDRVRVRDLDSRNGIFLAGHRVFDACLSAGGQFQLGETVIELRSNQARAQIEVKHLDQSGHLVGRSQGMRKLFVMLSRLANRDVNVLAAGETGTGKSVLARALHEQSHRRNGPFVVVNCGALPGNLIESELFGYEKGAFTGANQRHDGVFGLAQGGTLFLDEISSLPLELQPKLLDVLERKQYRRLGGKAEIDADFRLVSASLGSLAEEVKAGRFREDLYYRLAVVELYVPPLRERLEDIPLLAQHIVERISQDDEIHLNADAIKKLQRYIWPGNIRELRNILERTITFLDDFVIGPDDVDLPGWEEVERTDDAMPNMASSSPSSATTVDVDQEQAHHLVLPLESPDGATTPLKQLLEQCERMVLQSQLENTKGDVEKAAEELQISKGWYYNRIKKYKLKK